MSHLFKGVYKVSPYSTQHSTFLSRQIARNDSKQLYQVPRIVQNNEKLCFRLFFVLQL